MQYNLLDPFVTMYSDIKDLEQLGIAANNPYFAVQLITFSLQIINNKRDFDEGMCTWHQRPAVDKNWINFKTHFEDEHNILRQGREAMMRNKAFH